LAKLNAPLFSFNASGKLANALVYFGWKGLDCVRSYVIPANPKPTAQNTQRGYVTAAVTAIHVAQGLAADAWASLDSMAYALWGSCYATPRTWFNQAVKNWIDVSVAGKTPSIFYDAVIDAAPATTHISLDIDAKVTVGTAKCFYGTSKTALINSVACTGTPPNYLADITPTVPGTKYFFQVRANTGEAGEGVRRGIYYAVST